MLLRSCAGAHMVLEVRVYLSAPPPHLHHLHHPRTLTRDRRPSPSRCSRLIRLPHSVITTAPVPPGSGSSNHSEVEWAANCGIATVIKEPLLIFIHIINGAVALLLHCIKKKKDAQGHFALLLAIRGRENNTPVWIECPSERSRCAA